MKEGKFKIICTDSYDRDTVSNKLVCDNLNNYYGKLIVDFFM